MSTELVFLVLYFIAMAGIGFATARMGSGGAEDYLLGGRTLGAPVTALRLQSSSMSGYMFLGAGSLAYTQGYFGMWYALGDLGGGILNLSVLGRRMRKLSQLLGSITSIEYLEHRYPSRWTRIIASSIALFCLFFYVLSQFIAGGRGLAMVTGVPYPAALLAAIGVIALYTFLGGYLAVAYTDFVQAIVMFIGVLWILIATLMAVGGPTEGHQKVARIDETLLTMWGRGLQNQGQWGLVLGALLVFSIGYMGWPHVVVSHMAMRRPSEARMAGVYSTAFNLLFIPAPYIVGVLALVVVPGLANPEMAIFATADAVLPDFAVGIVMAAIMAAIMSTADALLLQGGTIASHDLLARFVKADLTQRQRVWVSRTTVLVLGAIGYLVAVNEPPAVAAVVIFATTILGAAFVPAYVAAAWWPRANTVGAISSMLVGTATVIAWLAAGLEDALGVDAMAVGVLASTAAMVVGSLATARSHPVPRHVRAAVAEAARVGPVPTGMLAGQNDELAGQVPPR
ncbi:sodium/proline symporter PutP [Salinifilum aidingensis]